MYIIVPTFKYIIVGQEAFNSLLLCVRKMLLRLLVDSDNYLRMKKFTSLKGNLVKLIACSVKNSGLKISKPTE